MHLCVNENTIFSTQMERLQSAWLRLRYNQPECKHTKFVFEKFIFELSKQKIINNEDRDHFVSIQPIGSERNIFSGLASTNNKTDKLKDNVCNDFWQLAWG